jgi:hypothetical protein
LEINLNTGLLCCHASSAAILRHLLFEIIYQSALSARCDSSSLSSSAQVRPHVGLRSRAFQTPDPVGFLSKPPRHRPQERVHCPSSGLNRILAGHASKLTSSQGRSARQAGRPRPIHMVSIEHSGPGPAP